MILTAWRIVKQKHAGTALSGEGARRFGGRWNSPGFSVVYAAESQALAALEMLVHFDEADLLTAYAAFQVRLDEALVERIPTEQLPTDWQEDPTPASTRLFGDTWVSEAQSVALAVPSAIIPAERNFLFNPRHPDFRELEVKGPFAFRFDPRLGGHRT